MTSTSITCDECKAQKGPTNGWWNLELGTYTIISGGSKECQLLVYPMVHPTPNGWHLCGILCVIKRVSKYLEHLPYD